MKFDDFVKLPTNNHKLPSSIKSLDEVVDNIIDIVADNLSKFELNIWCTGGIDSTMLIAIAEYANLPYTIHVGKIRLSQNIKYFEGTVEEYRSPLVDFCRKNYWAYSFLSNFNNKIITTGFYGDEYFCRTIWQIKFLADNADKKISDVVKSTDYIYHHINKYKNRLTKKQ